MTAPTASMIPEQEVRDALAPHYVLERELGRGGMGAVYLARDVQLDRPVAIKFLPPQLAARPELRARFLQETRTAASFSHPNIVPVHAVEERDGVLCFVMGYVDGETLGKRISRAGPLPIGEAVRLLQESAWALSYAHGRGIVHRDVKPDAERTRFGTRTDHGLRHIAIAGRRRIDDDRRADRHAPVHESGAGDG